MRNCCVCLLLAVALPCLAGEATSKKAVPDAASQQAVLQTITSIYKPDYENAKTQQQKQELAKKLLSVSIATTDDATGQFVLLRVARDIAAQQGDLSTAFDCISHMSEAFDVDPLPMKLSAIQTAAKTLTGYLEHQNFADQIAPCVTDAIANDQYDVAKSFCEIALYCAQEGRDPNKAQLIQGRMQQVEEMASAFQQVNAAMQTLASDPAHPDANAAVGRYLCFIKGEWESGLKLIALGNDENLKTLASLEAATNPDPVQIGDQWLSIGEALNGLERFNVDVRAADWYRKALPATTGLTKARITERLKHLPPPQSGGGQMVTSSGNTAQPIWNDLLAPIQAKEIDIADLVKRGSPSSWGWTNVGLTCRSEQPTRIEFPVEFPNEYDLEIDFTVSGHQAFSDVHFALPIGNRNVPFTVRRKDRKTLFSFWGGKGFGEDPKTGNYVPWADGPQRHAISFRMRNDGIAIDTPGKSVLEIKDIDYIKQEVGNAFAITTSTSISVHSIKLAEKSQFDSENGLTNGGTGRTLQDAPADKTQTKPSSSMIGKQSDTVAKIDLLELVDTRKDAQSGAWLRNRSGLAVDGFRSKGAALTVPYNFPIEYDLKLHFTITAIRPGLSELYVLLPDEGGVRQFVVRRLDSGGTVFDFMGAGSFGKVPGRGTTVGPVVGQNVVLEIQMRDEAPTVKLNGQQITQLRDYSMTKLAQSLTSNQLGFWVPQDRFQILFHGIELVEVTGKGSASR